jgi:hypothetical protein
MPAYDILLFCDDEAASIALRTAWCLIDCVRRGAVPDRHPNFGGSQGEDFG